MKTNALSFLVILVAIFVNPGTGSATLVQYLEQYAAIQPTPLQEEKLSAFDELISYFSSITYFPGKKVHPDFIRALILAESNAEPGAVSNKQAHGLTQILVTTGREAIESMVDLEIDFHALRYIDFSSLRDLKAEELRDPAVNIMIACYMISKYNHDYNGRLDLVVSAWNAGAGSIQYDCPPDYDETLNLIGKVNGYFTYYLNKQSPLEN